MDRWRATFLGIKQLPRELTAFEIEAFFTFTGPERAVIEERREPELKLGLALQIGFLRMSGRLLNAVRIVPPVLWHHLGRQFGVAAPDLASLRALYRRRQTLFDHQALACDVLHFRSLRERERRALVRAIHDELTRTTNRERLAVFARHWLVERRLIVIRARDLYSMIAAAVRQYETRLAKSIQASVEIGLLERWRQTLIAPHASGLTTQNWLWAAPAKHSTRQIAEVLDRIETLYELEVHRHVLDVPEGLLRRYARRLAERPPSIGARIQEPARTLEVACFLRYCLLITTDRLLWMVRRRVADLWRHAALDAAKVLTDWADLYRGLLGSLGHLVADTTIPDAQVRERLQLLIADHQQRKPPTRAHLIRERLIAEIRPVRALLSALVALPWQAADGHPVTAAITLLKELYAQNCRALPIEPAIDCGPVWRALLGGADRERAFCALEVATLSALRRALRNGTVWIEHSLAFRSREALFIPENRWKNERRAHYRRLALPTDAAVFLEPLIERAKAGVAAVAQAAHAGELRIDDELHLTPLAPEVEDPQVAKLRAALDHRIGEAQLPDIILAVDAQVRFSWIMLGREPRSEQELLMVYAGILAHGTSMSAAQTARMIPSLTAASVRQAMRWASDERRLQDACRAVLDFMQRHPITTAWGRADLASSDMMSLETSKRVWQARIDPRRQTPSIGIYSHVHDRWGIFHAQPIVLNERQAGAAIEGVVRQEKIETSQLATDTHGYTDMAMASSRALGFDLCPRLKALKERHLFLPRGSEVPEILKSICSANLDLSKTTAQWDEFVRLAASIDSGYSSAVNVLMRFGSAARGDPLYDAGVELGKLLRTIFLCDYFVNPVFRRELLRVLNRGEATNALKRALYTGRVAAVQARQEDEMQAVADALSLLANIVMAWNTDQMQGIFDQWNQRRATAIPPELIGRIAPTHIEGINLRGVFRFPVEEYAEQLLPSSFKEKTPQWR